MADIQRRAKVQRKTGQVDVSSSPTHGKKLKAPCVD